MELTNNILKILSARIKKIIWVLGYRAFLIILLFIFIDLILGGFIFYKYVFLAEKQIPNASGIIKFNDKAYQNVLEELQIRE